MGDAASIESVAVTLTLIVIVVVVVVIVSLAQCVVLANIGVD